MSETLNNTLAIVLPYLTSALASPEILPRIEQLARRLPPIALGGFEIRLAEGAEQVDLLQCISQTDGFPLLVTERIAQTSADEPALIRIRNFCMQWVDSTRPLHRSINDIWLEYDLTEDALVQVPIPSVFMTFAKHDLSAADALDALDFGVNLLWGREISPEHFSKIKKCFDACSDQARVAHVGVMLSRSIDAVRLNVQRLRPHNVVSYLEQIGFSPVTDELVSFLTELFEQVDNVTLALDVGARILPRLGLECSFDKELYDEPRWALFLDRLVALGLCTRAKRDALLNWPGMSNPPDTLTLWPDHLIVRSLLQTPERFGVLGRRLSHIKFVYQAGASLEAKAYFGFGHLWKGPQGSVIVQDETLQDHKTLRVPNPPSETNVRSQAMHSAITAATNFLLASRNDMGWWEDFRLPAGESDEWVTAYVGTVLATLNNPSATTAAHEAWSLLLTRRDISEGWGYSGTTPSDGDTTGWALQLAALIGVKSSERGRRAGAFLERHLRTDGGVTTYGIEEPIREWMNMPRPAPFEGWLQSHVCVTGAVAALDEWGDRTRKFLAQAQQKEGGWRAYWWCDHEYATAYAAEALANGSAEERTQGRRAVEWTAEQLGLKGYVTSPQRPGGSPFATALSLRTLLLASNEPTVRPIVLKTVEWLFANQRADGSWSPSARLRVPPPAVLDPDKNPRGTLSVLDQQRNFTTATVLGALRLAQQSFSHQARSA